MDVLVCSHNRTRYMDGNTRYRKCLDCGQTRPPPKLTYTDIELEIIIYQRGRR